MEGRKEESLSLLYPSAFTAPGAVLDHGSGSPACLSNLVQGAEINSMLFLPPPLPTQTLGILLSLSLSSSRRRCVLTARS